jgi:hypothetical protein
MQRITERVFFARAILAALAVLIAAALGGCHYDQSPAPRWQGYRIVKVR